MDSMFKRKALLVAGSVLFFLMFLAVSSPTMAAKTTLKMQSALPVSSNYYGEMQKCVQAINQSTNGEVTMTIFPPGALTKPLEIIDSVKRGAVEGGFSTGAYAVKKMPEGLFEQCIPMSFAGERFTFEAPERYYEFLYTWQDGKIFKIFQDLYAERNIYLVGEAVASSYGFLTNFEVNRLDDLKGKKIRSFGLYSFMIQTLGASPTSIENSEQYLALQRGTVDGTVYTYSALDTYNLKEVVKNVVFPPVMQTPAVNMIINLDVWNKLSPENQKIITKTYRAHAESFSHIALEDEKRAIENAKKAGNLKVTTLPEEDVQKLKEAGRKTWDIAKEKSETSAQLIELLTEYLNEKGIY